MAWVTVRDLRNHGGEVLDRVEAGERVTVTRNGRPVAELVPLARRPLSNEELVARAVNLPPVDPAAVRADVDRLLDTGFLPEP
jgi:prevent-host-death family protein